MNKTEFLLLTKMSQKYKYREMLELTSKLSEVDDVNLTTLKAVVPDLELLYQLQQIIFDLELRRNVQRIKKICGVISFFDAAYPEKLREIYRPPLLLFYQGDIRLLNGHGVAIVGARKNSAYSRQILQELVPALVAKQKIIISGLAEGVDCLAHEYALAAGGATIGIIGSGVNHFYPERNHALQKQVAKKGLLLSEYLPDTPPARFRFPERNRLIAGVAEDVVVTEARQRSGSLITANVALQENRNVFAIPGPITSPLSAGTNELIAAGATPIIDFSLDNFS
ncbi:DNA protecting protein DprA [Amylolactobacillus amylotrophicus DSM 20534]|uniref:DNA protecting protein DprA n=3 Tax=Amylolactobacillus TaxID=2767876 RepID=A0A1L6XDX3_9LACO|nr:MULTISPECIES: DNA-processing protein DprA [Amylolactobacillus]APT19183.1 DNA protecting protein DprA [Amylolactobacillus amylophilus DSM 20533 = JCM 1125]KRK38543.1 DNA protecting protein DprA [Amylolactobacillus amylotrophicus DSM 20534]KRM42814.1 DNA protecting protein DprA [Amylolactobacillus amylophilus DSM 20533 = JCM 1125]GED79677.1 DNA processing protein DprA [Amylolactobacillus amylophilus]